MKLRAISIAIVLAGIAGAAFAGNSQQTLGTVNVTGHAVAACTPPNDAAGHACDGYNQFVRANFTSREIGMLFGYRSSYPEYLSSGIDNLQRRYQTLLQQFVAQQSVANASAEVASK